MDKINLGDKVKDSVTGFTGIVVALHKWLHGCTRCTVQPAVGKDGKLPEANAFDMPQLVVISKNKVKVGQGKTGGPRSEIHLRRETERSR